MIYPLDNIYLVFIRLNAQNGTIFMFTHSLLSGQIRRTKMILYRIHTEAINESKVKRILDAAFDGYTVLKGRGCWHGKLENSLTIEIYTDEDDILLAAICEKIKKANNQESVLLVKIPVKFAFI
jgi:hypothetical protein